MWAWAPRTSGFDRSTASLGNLTIPAAASNAGVNLREGNLPCQRLAVSGGLTIIAGDYFCRIPCADTFVLDRVRVTSTLAIVDFEE